MVPFKVRGDAEVGALPGAEPDLLEQGGRQDRVPLLHGPPHQGPQALQDRAPGPHQGETQTRSRTTQSGVGGFISA